MNDRRLENEINELNAREVINLEAQVKELKAQLADQEE